VLIAALLLSAALLLALYLAKPWRPSTRAAAGSAASSSAATADASRGGTPSPPGTAPGHASATARSTPRLWPAVATTDLPTLISRLRALGFPAAIIRAIVLAQINPLYDARLRALSAPDPSLPFWRQPSSLLRTGTKEMEEYSRLQRERSRLLADLFKDPFFASDEITAAQRRQFGNLPRQKIDQLQRIEDDYAEMISAVRAGTNGITLAEDREKLALLEKEKHADLAAVLTPEELADYELRSSPLTRMLSNYLGEFQPTLAEFRAIVDAQRAFGELMGGSPSGVPPGARQAAMKALNEGLQAGLGPARYADYLRETSSEYQQLSRLAQRENLPADAATRAFNLRDTVSTESNRIVDDPTLDTDQKLAALQSLAQNTRAQLLTLLGPVAGNAYLKLNETRWLGEVERGNAVTFNTGGPQMTVTNGTTMAAFGSSTSYRAARPVSPGNMPFPPR
jgi:hypothetical protein